MSRRGTSGSGRISLGTCTNENVKINEKNNHHPVLEEDRLVQVQVDSLEVDHLGDLMGDHLVGSQEDNLTGLRMRMWTRKGDEWDYTSRGTTRRTLVRSRT